MVPRRGDETRSTKPVRIPSVPPRTGALPVSKPLAPGPEPVADEAGESDLV